MDPPKTCSVFVLFSQKAQNTCAHSHKIWMSVFAYYVVTVITDCFCKAIFRCRQTGRKYLLLCRLVKFDLTIYRVVFRPITRNTCYQTRKDQKISTCFPTSEYSLKYK